MADQNGVLTVQLLNLQEVIHDYHTSSLSFNELRKDHVTLISQSRDLLLQNYNTDKEEKDLIFTYYDFCLKRSFILSLFELLFISLEPSSNYSTLSKEIFQIVQSHNRFVSMATRGVASSKLKCTFADVMDIFVSSRGRILGNHILATKPLPLHLLIKRVEFEIQLTRTIIGEGRSLLLFDENIQDNSDSFGAESWHESIRLVDSELQDIVDLINWRVWQFVCHLMSSHFCGLINNQKEIKDFEVLFQQIIQYSGELSIGPVVKCFWYIFNCLRIEELNNKIYSVFQDHYHILLLYNTLPSTKTNSTNIINSFTTPSLLSFEPSLSLNPPPSTSQTNVNKLAVATETDKLRLLSPIFSSMCSIVLSLCHWLVQSLQYSIEGDKLESIIVLLFNEGPSLLTIINDFIDGCGQVGVSRLSAVSSSSCQLRVNYWSKYEELFGSLKWIENKLSKLCRLFFDQWKNKCHLILETHFPSSLSSWRQSRGEREEPLYVSVIKDQLLEPLIDVCSTLREGSVQEYVLQLSCSVLFCELREYFLLLFGKKKRNIDTSSQEIVTFLQSDFTSLLNYLTLPSNKLRPSTHAMINQLGACRDIEIGLKILSGKWEESVGVATSGRGGCQDSRLLKIGSKLDIIERVAWLDYRDWYKLVS